MTRPVRPAAVTAAGVVCGVALCSATVEAHLNSSGFGPIYDGALHILLSPEDLVPAVALALLAGLRGARYGRLALFALPGAWLFGGLAGMAVGQGSSTTAAMASFVVLGALVAADAHLSLSLLAVLTVSLGLLHGYVNGVDMGRPGAGAPALAGLTAMLFVVIAIVAAFVVQLRQTWSRVAVRVLGSWIVASGLLMLGWAMRPLR